MITLLIVGLLLLYFVSTWSSENHDTSGQRKEHHNTNIQRNENRWTHSITDATEMTCPKCQQHNQVNPKDVYKICNNCRWIMTKPYIHDLFYITEINNKRRQKLVAEMKIESPIYLNKNQFQKKTTVQFHVLNHNKQIIGELPASSLTKVRAAFQSDVPVSIKINKVVNDIPTNSHVEVLISNDERRFREHLPEQSEKIAVDTKSTTKLSCPKCNHTNQVNSEDNTKECEKCKWSMTKLYIHELVNVVEINSKKRQRILAGMTVKDLICLDDNSANSRNKTALKILNHSKQIIGELPVATSDKVEFMRRSGTPVSAKIHKIYKNDSSKYKLEILISSDLSKFEEHKPVETELDPYYRV